MKIENWMRGFKELFTILDSYISEEEKFDLAVYIDEAKTLIEVLENMNKEEIVETENIFQNDLVYLREDLIKTDNSDNKIVLFSEMVFHYYTNCRNIRNESEEREEGANKFIDDLEDYLFQRIQKNEKYYKRLLQGDSFDEYEKVLNLLSNELKAYDMNLVHCKKILTFLEEFKENGIYINETIFLRNYLSNALDSMILTINKFYFDHPDIGKKENCGIKYIISYFNKHVIQSARIHVQNDLGVAAKHIKTIERTAKGVDEVRKSVIAHFDIEKIDDQIKNFKIGIEDLEKVFNLSCEILEIYSFQYFKYKDRFHDEMLSIHGFKAFICQNVMMHNPNKYAISDLDMFLNLLKKDFISK